MPAPAVQARATRDFIAYLDVTDPGRTAAVMARVPEAARAALAAAGPTDWISIEHTHHWVDAYVDAVGADAAREAIASCVETRLATSPLTREIVRQLATLSGQGPQAIARFAPHALSLGYRDFFRPRVLDVHETGALVLLEDLAPELIRYSAYFLCFEGILTGALRFAGRAGTVAITLSDDRSARCEFVWERPSHINAPTV